MQISRICGRKGTAFLLNYKTLEAFISYFLAIFMLALIK